ncbi:hypothetical protein PANDA_021746 [Ailuropoda melanoleuca]|uniref:Uncharacterized protein n=1 Tax=Ailuropoda melanoleuca TaxID=9646 RepID=D2I769_AILME|nr:hypothetical protein PANDA_021746 [Ailuropoda melanoleuca]
MRLLSAVPGGLLLSAATLRSAAQPQGPSPCGVDSNFWGGLHNYLMTETECHWILEFPSSLPVLVKDTLQMASQQQGSEPLLQLYFHNLEQGVVVAVIILVQATTVMQAMAVRSRLHASSGLAQSLISILRTTDTQTSAPVARKTAVANSIDRTSKGQIKNIVPQISPTSAYGSLQLSFHDQIAATIHNIFGGVGAQSSPGPTTVAHLGFTWAPLSSGLCQLQGLSSPSSFMLQTF